MTGAQIFLVVYMSLAGATGLMIHHHFTENREEVARAIGEDGHVAAFLLLMFIVAFWPVVWCVAILEHFGDEDE